MEKITKIVSYSNENQNQIINIEKVFEEMKFENDIKVFSLLYGLFDKNIYANIKNRSGVLKHVLIIFLISSLKLKKTCSIYVQH